MKHADPANRMNIANDATRRFERKFYFPEGAGSFLNGRMIPPIGYEFVESWSCDDLRVRVFQLIHAAPPGRPVFTWPDAGTSPAREQGDSPQSRGERGEKQGGGA